MVLVRDEAFNDFDVVRDEGVDPAETGVDGLVLDQAFNDFDVVRDGGVETSVGFVGVVRDGVEVANVLGEALERGYVEAASALK